ncbi:hypothetical protein BC828DRAFT_381769 [Blastocladiella britannica]|nr:hypothetical protein BC828DRAFT_381769 [Blastocladiella britannica]
MSINDPQLRLTTLTSSHYVLSGESFLLGPTLILLSGALIEAYGLCKSHRSYYYVAFLVLVILRVLDVSVNSYMWASDASTRHSLFYAQITIEWIAGHLLLILNLIRLHVVCATTRPKIVRFLVGCTICILLLLNFTSGYYLVDWLMGSSIKNTDRAYAAWSGFDALLNATISLVFVVHLEAVVVEANANQAYLRRTLFKVKALLASDATIILTSALIQLCGPDLDPLWSVYFFSEGFRLCMVSHFLVLLNRIMRQDRRLQSVRVVASKQQSTTTRWSHEMLELE